MENRNQIEMQAISALEHLGSLVLFLIDDSEDCGTSVEEQQNLLDEVSKLLPGTELVIISTKADIHETQPLNWQEVKDAEKEYIDGGEEVIADIPLLIDSNDNITISAQENVGLEGIKMEIVRFIKESQDPEDRMKLPEVGIVQINHIRSIGSIPNPSIPERSNLDANFEIRNSTWFT